MKTKLHFKELFLFLFLIISSSLFSQPLSGIYTVGGISPDYISFSAAVGAIQNNGVSGPVTFNVRNGLYIEKVSMYQFAGSSLTNTVTFQSEDGDSSLVILSDSSSAQTINNFTLQIFGADNIIFQHITIQRPGTLANGRVVEIGNNSDNITLSGNRIMAGSGTAATIAKCLVYSDSSNQNTEIVITGNLMVSGNHGIYKLASQLETGNVITNNVFQNQYIGSIYVDKQDGINISKNTITVTGSTNYRAITHSRSVNCTTNKNKISIVAGYSGVYYLNCSPLAGSENLVSNNFIQIAGTTANSGGIFISNTDNLKVFHNSVHMNGTSATSSALYSIGTGNSGIQIKNNIFKNSGTGYAIRVADTNALAVSDFNDILSAGLNVGSYNTANAPLLSDWQTLSSQDANSISADPTFTSATDLHVASVAVNDQGTPIGAIVTDIDGESRSLTSPDPGADEFTPMNNNVTLTSIIAPAIFACGDSNTIISVIVQNLGIDTAVSIPVTIDISGAALLILNDTLPGPLGSFESDTLTFSGIWSTYQGGVFTLKCYTSLPNDEYLLNDTIIKTIKVAGIPDTPVVISPQAFCTGNVNISAQTDSGNVIFWFSQPAGGNIIFTGNPFSPPVTSDTVFYAEAHNGPPSGLRITEMGLNTPDHIEIQNCSTSPIDVNGWVVALSASYTDINLENTILWNLSSLGTMAPGQIEYKTDGAANNYWGNNILWNPTAATPGWAIIIDSSGNVVDFVVYGWADTSVQNFNSTINGFPITLGIKWIGSSINAVCGTTNALSRSGSADNDDATDFICVANTLGTQNTVLSVPFASCGSSRVPVNVTIFSLPVVDLGPDTVSALPVTFDAGAGFVSYLWNTSATTQTINVSTTGTYTVIVTDGNGCSATDSVHYTSTVGIYELSSLKDLKIFPIPADEQLTILLTSKQAQEIQVLFYNSLGELALHEQMAILSGTQKLFLHTGQCPAGVYNLEIRYADGIINKKVILH